MHRLWTGDKTLGISAPGPVGETSGKPARPSIDRQVLALAVPALGALVAQPLFVLIDSAIVGHLGTNELAGLTLASTLLTTIVGLCVFLAYATTAGVARKMGAGRQREALEMSFDGIYLAALLGLVLGVALYAAAPMAVAAFGAPAAVEPHAVAYLRWSAPGLPGMLIVLAATGALRGVRDTRSTLIVAGAGAGVNSALNFALVYGANLGIAGSGLGTAITETAMALALCAIVVARSRHLAVRLKPRLAGIVANARGGLPLFVRTLALRLAILATMRGAVALGAVPLAAHQVVNALWGFASYALDALAIAAQALIGTALGARDLDLAQAVRRRTTSWGWWVGIGLGMAMAAGSGVFPQLFSTDPAVRTTASHVLLVTAVLLPLAGYVYVLDGVLMGASDSWFLALGGTITFVLYVPVLLVVERLAPGGEAGLMALWATFGVVFLGLRAITNGYRAHTTRWLR